MAGSVRLRNPSLSGSGAGIRPIRRAKQGRDLPWPTLIRALQAHYGQGTWRVPVLRARGADPFHVLVSTMLSHRTRDEVTERATHRLLSHFPTPQAIANAPLARIEDLIAEVGLTSTKARGIQRASRAILERFGGTVPPSERDLLSLPLVGPKTAHAVRVFGFERDALPIDTHILRVAQRLGAVRSRSIAGAQRELAREVPRRYWKMINPLLVQHGQNICRASSPECAKCPIEPWCPRTGVRTD